MTVTVQPDTITKLIWTRAYRPFIMGGDVHAPMGAELECTVVDLGLGFKGLVAVCPDGELIVAEFETGAIVGSTVEQVRQDIAEGEVHVMIEQVQEAKTMIPRVINMGVEKFWKEYAGGRHMVNMEDEDGGE